MLWISTDSVVIASDFILNHVVNALAHKDKLNDFLFVKSRCWTYIADSVHGIFALNLVQFAIFVFIEDFRYVHVAVTNDAISIQVIARVRSPAQLSLLLELC